MVDGIENNYAKLAAKHNLPSFSELDRQFQLSDIEDSKFPLSAVREKIFDKIRMYTDFLSEVLQPDTNLINLYESRVFPEHEKHDVYNLFRNLMKWRRAALAAGISASENKDAGFISSFFDDWKAVKPKLLETVERLSKSWETDSEETEKLGYFG